MFGERTMETYSTFDIAKLFNIKRTRLQEWIDEDFIQPYKPADGYGVKAIFRKHELYTIRLFMFLLNMGLKRFEAADYSNLVNWENIGEGKDGKQYAVMKKRLDKGELRFGHFLGDFIG